MDEPNLMLERSPMIRLAALAATLAAVAASVFALTASAGAAKAPQLIGVVGKNDAFKITLTNKGKLVKTLKAGTYTFVIHDDSKIHNYELDGPKGKSWTFTSVGFVGTKTKTLKLTAGKYKAYCSPHESTMFQHFTVK
jgi:plastocyanin